MQPLRLLSGPYMETLISGSGLAEGQVSGLGLTEDQPVTKKTAIAPRKKADPRKKHKRKLAEKSKRRNRR